MMVLHVYAWGRRHHSVIKGFPTAFYRGVNDAVVPRFLYSPVSNFKITLLKM